MKKEIRTEHSDTYPAAKRILEFIAGEFEDFADINHLDLEGLDINLEYGRYPCPWKIRKGTMNIFMDHFVLFKFELIADPNFRTLVSELIRCFIEGVAFSRVPQYGDPKYYYDIDFEVPPEDVEPFLRRMLLSYGTHTELIGLWDYYVDRLTDEDRETLGYIASNFIRLILVLDQDDLLFYDFINRIEDSKRAYRDTFGTEPPPIGT